MQNQNIEAVSEILFSTKSSSELMNDKIKNSLRRMKESQLRRLKPSVYAGEMSPISEEDYEKITELADYLSYHIREVGKEQAILDFQVGINLLNDYKKHSIIQSKVQLKEDSDFGEKTLMALLNIMKLYPVDVIKKYIKLGALNNQIWATKNLNQIDTDKKVENTANKLKERNV